jgi:hypothetical protein
MEEIKINEEITLQSSGYVAYFNFKNGAIQTASTTDALLANLLQEQRKTNELLTLIQKKVAIIRA